MADNLSEKERALKVLDELGLFLPATTIEKYKEDIRIYRQRVVDDDPTVEADAPILLAKLRAG
jgi:hypothetical protein